MQLMAERAISSLFFVHVHIMQVPVPVPEVCGKRRIRISDQVAIVAGETKLILLIVISNIRIRPELFCQQHVVRTCMGIMAWSTDVVFDWSMHYRHVFLDDVFMALHAQFLSRLHQQFCIIARMRRMA